MAFVAGLNYWYPQKMWFSPKLVFTGLVGSINICTRVAKHQRQSMASNIFKEQSFDIFIFNFSALAGILLKSGSVYFFSEQFFGRSE